MNRARAPSLTLGERSWGMIMGSATLTTDATLTVDWLAVAV